MYSVIFVRESGTKAHVHLRRSNQINFVCNFGTKYPRYLFNKCREPFFAKEKEESEMEEFTFIDILGASLTLKKCY